MTECLDCFLVKWLNILWLVIDKLLEPLDFLSDSGSSSGQNGGFGGFSFDYKTW